MIELKTALHGKHTERISKHWDESPFCIDGQILKECGINPESLDSEMLCTLIKVSECARHYGYYCGTRSAEYQHEKQIREGNKAGRSATAPKEQRRKWFNEFYELYPKKVKYTAAEKMFMKVCRNESDFHEIMDGLNRLIVEDYRHRQPFYIPNPDTFLKGNRWTDEPLKASNLNEDNAPLNQGLLA